MKGSKILSKTYIAVDIGASSGRVIAGSYKNGKVYTKEMHRFENTIIKENEHCYWNVDRLFDEILTGLKKCGCKFEEIVSIGIDTWAVDYVLLNEEGDRVAPVFAYRDHRTDNTMEKVFGVMSPERIYEKTGIQFMPFNTLYQLYEHRLKRPKDLDVSKIFLMLPDYLNYLLCGKKVVEFTNATSTQFLNLIDRAWDNELLNLINISTNLFPEIVEPGTVIGKMLPGLEKLCGLENVNITAPATHDTGAAIAAIPSQGDDFVYISSGTWSLMGIESKKAITSRAAYDHNFTNEGGVFRTYRVLKNIMGLWLVHEVKKHLEIPMDFSTLVDLAKDAQPFKCLINPNDGRFLNPDNMIEEIKSYCLETNQEIPKTPGELARCVFESLAFLYKQTFEELKALEQKEYKKVHIIGGGGKNKLLNQLCADFLDCQVLAGPFEATAIGNLVMQMIALGEMKDIGEARQVIKDSFKIEIFEPRECNEMKDNWDKFRRLQREK